MDRIVRSAAVGLVLIVVLAGVAYAGTATSAPSKLERVYIQLSGMG